MKQYQVSLPVLGDESLIEATSPKNAVFTRLSELDDSDLDELDIIDATVLDELGSEFKFQLTPGRTRRFCCHKV
jgi:hypothetical protein